MPLPQEDYTHTHTHRYCIFSLCLSFPQSVWLSQRLQAKLTGIPPLLQELFVKAFSLILCSTTGKCKH